MLELKNVTKQFKAGTTIVDALKGVSIKFGKKEFVSILGPSGGGKSTLLTIIGGLDQYTTGDMLIDGKSTKDYKDRDWDAYRNNVVGFVFQSYNLIPHQTVLANVELALTISGVSKEDRTRRATEALEKVGLGDQLKKRPNQLSGGQMQRVAIARALVNNPEVILADEPTGALDTVTSVQIMELLREVAKDRLVIMVTHNPDLAKEYSTRVIELRDGLIKGDSKPHDDATEEGDQSFTKKKKVSMSFFTALSLSLKNLMAKKGRTFMVSFAGSIGIIGIAVILALSNGVNTYVANVEEETLTGYPLTIEEQTVDISAMLGGLMGSVSTDEGDVKTDAIYSNNIMLDMLNSMVGEVKNNDLGAFKTYLESGDSGLDPLVTGIQYGYSTPINVFKVESDSNGKDKIMRVNPSALFDELGLGSMMDMQGQTSQLGGSSMLASQTDTWKELIGNEKALASQYEVLAGRMPESYNEVIVITDANNRISDYTLYSLGLLDTAELKDELTKLMKNAETDESDDKADTSSTKSEEVRFTFDEILDLELRLVVNTDFYEEEEGLWLDKSEDKEYLRGVVEDSEAIKVVGVVKAVTGGSTTEMGTVGYTSELMPRLINDVNDSAIVKEQKSKQDINVFTGLKFQTDDAAETEDTAAIIQNLSPEQQQYMAELSDEERMELLQQYATESDATYEDNLAKLGVSDLNKPTSISIYPKDFESKESIKEIITTYNDGVTAAGDEDLVIKYTDMVGTMMSSVTTIINAISYILIAFVAISLIVSSIMIGIITYISVMERKKEIGILRSIGASKRDVSSVFNAETLIIGFSAGVLGILVSEAIILGANALIEKYLDIANAAILPWEAALVLVALSMLLAFIAGLIPSSAASKKDPVEALRSE